jgi:hypothetical protein
MASDTYELTFWGSPPVKFRREHFTYESAREEASRVYDKLVNDGRDTGKYKAIIHGPDTGRDGTTVWG